MTVVGVLVVGWSLWGLHHDSPDVAPQLPHSAVPQVPSDLQPPVVQPMRQTDSTGKSVPEDIPFPPFAPFDKSGLSIAAREFNIGETGRVILLENGETTIISEKLQNRGYIGPSQPEPMDKRTAPYRDFRISLLRVSGWPGIRSISWKSNWPVAERGIRFLHDSVTGPDARGDDRSAWQPHS